MKLGSTSSSFKNTVLMYLNHGGEESPFTDVRKKKIIKSTVNSELPPTTRSKCGQTFLPFCNERDIVGKLVGEQVKDLRQKQLSPLQILKRRYHTDYAVAVTEDSKPVFDNQNKNDIHEPLPKKKFSTPMKDQMNAPYLTCRSSNSNNVLVPLYKKEELDGLKVLKSLQIKTNEDRVQLDLVPNQVDKKTNFVTKVQLQSPRSQTSNLLQSELYYRQKQTKVEDGCRNILRNQGTNLHHAMLIGKSYKFYSQQMPAVGVYTPSYECSDKHLPFIPVKGGIKQNLKTDYIIQSKCKRGKRKATIQHDQSSQNDDNYEQLYAKTIAQINKEVDLERQRNPSERLRPNGVLTLNTAITQEDAIEYRNQMRTTFKNLKESLNKIKNMINLRK